MASKELETTSLGLAVSSSADLASLQELAETIRTNERVEVVDDPEQISREIFEQLLASEDDVALNQLGSATGWRELEGIQVLLGDSFRWRPSSYDEGAPIFLVVPVTVVEETGELGARVVLTTGSMNVIAQLMNLAARGTYRSRVVTLIRAEKASARGFYPLWLRIENPTDPAEVNAAAPAAVEGD